MTVFELNDDELFVALLTRNDDDGVRELGYADFADFDAARAWADDSIRDAVNTGGDGWDYRVDVVRSDRDEFESDRWGVDADSIVARAGWDRAGKSITWQTDGPFAGL
ncbi:hypothetical protein [Nocardia wallacei]|uniref:hypothetical protein n=1 Tax=Nocardia wallacei TaxID=480035 RepID=UPI002458D596|nr:hypothetical protein [Nocardia wallacei]